MAFDQSKFLARFIDESREHCSRLSDGLLSLEHAPHDSETLNGLFRSAHTIKGSSRMLKQLAVSDLAHRMEDVLDGLRSALIPFSSSLSDALFRGVDTLTVMLDRLASGEAPQEAPADLYAELAFVACGRAGQSAQEASSATADGKHESCGPEAVGDESPLFSPGTSLETIIGDLAATQSVHPQTATDGDARESHVVPTASRKVDYLRVSAAKLDDLIRLMGEIVSEHSRFGQHVRRLKEI
ncbi:MAG: Hpt domain-containing protein, partial [Desulfuromonadales bacterium]|nr:Hpt domain-containing protein [Desulfuromonadales bacterium]